MVAMVDSVTLLKILKYVNQELGLMNESHSGHIEGHNNVSLLLKQGYLSIFSFIQGNLT